MFTKDDVGRKVISNEGHWNNTIGVIKEWDDYNTKYPVMVDFCNGLCDVLAGFAIDGKCCVENLGSIRFADIGDNYIEVVESPPKKDTTLEEWSNPVSYTIGGIVERKIDSITSLLKVIEEPVLPQAIVNNQIVPLSPELIAEYFWELDSEQQARFYNHLDTVADFQFPFQLQSITDEDGLTLAGRRVMQHIGEYSHWGLVPKLKYDGSIK